MEIYNDENIKVNFDTITYRDDAPDYRIEINIDKNYIPKREMLNLFSEIDKFVSNIKKLQMPF